jgi:hypothetical protein
MAPTPTPKRVGDIMPMAPAPIPRRFSDIVPEQPTGKESLGRIPDYTSRFPGRTRGATGVHRGASAFDDDYDDNIDDDSYDDDGDEDEDTAVRIHVVPRSARSSAVYSGGYGAGYSGGDNTFGNSSTSSAGTPSAILLMTPTGQLGEVSDDLHVVANTVSNAHKGATYDKEDMRRYRTQLVTRTNEYNLRPASRAIITRAKAPGTIQKAVTFELEPSLQFQLLYQFLSAAQYQGLF